MWKNSENQFNFNVSINKLIKYLLFPFEVPLIFLNLISIYQPNKFHEKLLELHNILAVSIKSTNNKITVFTVDCDAFYTLK